MGLTTGHSISSPSLLQGSSEALVLAWSSQQPDSCRSHPESPHHHVGIYEGFRIPMSGAGVGGGGGGGVKTNTRVFCHCTPGLGGSTRMKEIRSCIWESPVL